MDSKPTFSGCWQIKVFSHCSYAHEEWSEEIERELKK